MLRRLLILLALLLVPTLAQARGIEPQLVAEGPAPPGGEVELAIHMRTTRAGTAIGSTRATPACRWTSNGSCRRDSRRVRCAIRCRAGSTVAGLMNYVYERDYAVLVRLKVPAGARGTIPIRAERPLARLHRQDLRSRTGRVVARPAGRQPARRTARSSTSGGGRFRSRSRPSAHFDVAGGKLRVAIPLPASVAVGKPYLFPITDNVGRL